MVNLTNQQYQYFHFNNTSAVNGEDNVGTLLITGRKIDTTKITNHNSQKIHEFEFVHKKLNNARKISDSG